MSSTASLTVATPSPISPLLGGPGPGSGAAAVLLVDDDPRNLRLLGAVLHSLGVRLVLATSGAEALERAASEDFAVILLDVQMPAMDGFETAAHLKAAPRSQTTPILFLTATLGDGVVVNAYARGAVDYITKPFDNDILRSKVAVFVDLYLAKEEVRRQAAMLSDRERSDLLGREQVARADADKQVERLRFLADAGVALAVSLERDVILQALARSLVPRFCDFCTFDIAVTPEPPGSPLGLELLVVEHIDPRDADRIRQLRAAQPIDLAADAPDQPGIVRAFRTGTPDLYQRPDETPAGPGSVRTDVAEPLRTVFRELGTTSALVVAMRAHGEIMGVMTVGLCAGGAAERTPYTVDDLRLAEGIGVRAAVGLVNARLHGEARDAIRLRDDFLSVASHELRTPLTSLRLTVEGLQRSLAKDEKVAPKLHTAERQIGRLTDLIGQLLDVSRLVGGRLRLDLEDVDLVAVVTEIIARVQDLITRSGSRVDVHLPETCVGHWDALRIEQVVTNLLSNALKYGEGKPIDVDVALRGDVVELTVRDRGIGIDPAHQARIFERFERAVSIRHYGGFGLGLWITRQIVEALGGTVQVESAPGEGSVFIVELPRAASPAAVSASDLGG